MPEKISTDFNDLTPEQQDFILNYIRDNFEPIKNINYSRTAYGLKALFTRDYFFVTQEQFAEAMRRAGYKVVPFGTNGNSCFNISNRSLHLKKR